MPELARSIIASGSGRLQFDALRAAARRLVAYTDDRATDAQRAIASANDFLLLSLASAVIAVATLAAIVRLTQGRGSMEFLKKRMQAVETFVMRLDTPPPAP